MFLKKNNFREYQYFTRSMVTNDEGVTTETFENTKPIFAEIWPAGGRTQAELYGDRLNYIMNMNVDISEDIKELDRIAYNSDVPNYKIISIKNWTYHKSVELERI